MQTEKNMAGPYEIIVLDLDGTLTNRDKVITPRTKAALMKAQERGKKVVLASGRPTQGVMPLAKELHLDEYSGYILSFNGGRIINCKTGETVFARSLPVSANKKIIGLAEEHQVDIATYEGSRIISSNPESPYGRLESRINGMELWKPEDMKEYVNFEVPKFLMMEDGDYLAMVEPKVKAAMGKNFSVYRSDPFFLEVLPKGIDKAQSLERLLEEIYQKALGSAQLYEGTLITNARHAHALRQAEAALGEAICALEREEDLDCVTIDLNGAWMHLGEITGQTVSEEIIDRIFSKFCLGK